MEPGLRPRRRVAHDATARTRGETAADARQLTVDGQRRDCFRQQRKTGGWLSSGRLQSALRATVPSGPSTANRQLTTFMKALSFRDLTKTYRNGVQALKGIDLDVAEGDFFALLGPNGAGKTTAIG